jgi:hypothetical protein
MFAILRAVGCKHVARIGVVEFNGSGTMMAVTVTLFARIGWPIPTDRLLNHATTVLVFIGQPMPAHHTVPITGSIGLAVAGRIDTLFSDRLLAPQLE